MDIGANATGYRGKNSARLLLACGGNSIFGIRSMPESLSRNLIFNFDHGADITPVYGELIRHARIEDESSARTFRIRMIDALVRVEPALLIWLVSYSYKYPLLARNGDLGNLGPQ
jgi:hypothetical protein